MSSSKRKRDSSNTTTASNTKSDSSSSKNKPTTTTTKSSSSALSSQQFLSDGKSLYLTITDESGNVVLDKQECKAKQFSTGSLGWSLNGKKFTTTISGNEVKTQVNCNLIIDNSKSTTATKSKTAADDDEESD
ncbi:unnamed protein product [Rotaria sordida]|uniref:Uncharacterized protein n=1 Tax=Rotaria sordida TaxID=392033 RepID=A0A815KJ02_9BILA|nr:unnamed protein product [Rotaria sordida]CAF1396289.1 unnamed protein product [Rotaria sordida]